MLDPTASTKRNNASTRKEILFLLLKLLFISMIVIIVLFFASSPLRGKAANNYIAAGDRYLSEKKYLSAGLEYEKALKLDSKNITAKNHQDLAEKASGNILHLEDFFSKPQYSDQKEKLVEAKSVPKTESEAVKQSRELIEEKEYQLAIIPAQTAIEMDKEYRDGWLYLGIANLRSAESIEAKQSVRNEYLEKANEALKRATDLDPEYKPAQDFLKEAEAL